MFCQRGRHRQIKRSPGHLLNVRGPLSRCVPVTLAGLNTQCPSLTERGKTGVDMWGLETWNRGTKKDLACTIGGDFGSKLLQSSFTATPGKWEMTMKSSGGGERSDHILGPKGTEGYRTRQEKQQLLKGWTERVKNNRSKSMCPSMGDKDSSVCGRYFHYVWTKSLKSPRVIRDRLSSLQWEQRICVWGHYKHSVWALNSKSLCSGHTLSPLHSAIPLFSPLRAMETRRLSLCSFLQCLFFLRLFQPTTPFLSSPHWSSLT